MQVHHPAPGIRLALRLFAFWTLRGLESEARRWLVAFVELADRTARDGDRQRHDTGTRAEAIRLEDRALAITALGLMSSNQGDYRESVCQKIVERCVLHAELSFGRLIGTVSSEIRHAGLEPLQPFGDGSSNIADSDKADGLIAELAQVGLICQDEGRGWESSGASCIVRGHKPVQNNEHQHDRVLGHAAAVEAGIIRNRNPGGTNSVDVQVVIADGELLDETHARCQRQRMRIDSGASGHQDIRIRGAARQLLITRVLNRIELGASQQLLQLLTNKRRHVLG
jgi:hypothetical protein